MIRPPPGSAYWFVMSAVFIVPLSTAAVVVIGSVIGFPRKRRKNKKLREREEKERGATH